MAEFVKVEGLRELERKLADLASVNGEATGRRTLTSALVRAAKPMAADAAGRAPFKTGQLRRNVVAGAGRPREETALAVVKVKQLRQRARALKRRQDRAQGPVRRLDDAYYWRHVEFGTSRMRARPFLRPAFEAGKLKAVETFRTALAARIEKAIKKKI